mgnify:FL=1
MLHNTLWHYCNLNLKAFYFLSVILLLFGRSEMWANAKSSFEYQRFTESCMGTEFTILIDHPDQELARNTATQAFEEAHRLNQILSDYLSDSELSLLSNNSGSSNFYPISKDLFRVLTASQKLARETGGAFDITVGPFSRLWRIARFRKALPSKPKLLNAQKRVGYEKLILDAKKKTAQLVEFAMVLDLGGIAKGYAADQMLSVIKDFGIKRCLIDAGGDLVIGEPPLGKKGWSVDVGGKSHHQLPKLLLSNCSVSTSGDIEQFLEVDGTVYSHIIDPRTAIGISSRSQVTVIAKNGTTSDSLASACLVLGFDASLRVLKAYGVDAAFFIKHENGSDIMMEYKKKP